MGGRVDAIACLSDEIGDNEINGVVMSRRLGEIVRVHINHQRFMCQGKPALHNDPGFSVPLATENANQRFAQGGGKTGMQFVGQSLALSDVRDVGISG